jgi:outer membrane receptor protein involved in Fe transport
MIMLVAAGTARAETPAAPPPPALPLDRLTVTDDMIVAVGGRKIEGRRVEALVATGSEATHRGAARLTEKLGRLRVEVTGVVLASDHLGDQSDASARVAHETEHDALRADLAFGTHHAASPRQSFTTDGRALSYGAGWTAWRDSGRYEAQALGEHLALRDDGLALGGPRSPQPATANYVEHDVAAYSGRVGFTSRRLAAFGLDHELAAGASATSSSGIATTGDVSLDNPDMSALARTRRANSRFLRAYVHDTIRVIESLDISGGFVFEHWRWIASMPPLAHAHEQAMDVETPQMIDVLLGPRLGALYRVSPELALTAEASRSLRAPTWHQRMRPIQNGDVPTLPGADLRSATVIGGELGPAISTTRLEARAVAYYRDVTSPIAVVTAGDTARETTNLGRAREAGIDAAATVRLARPWLAGLGYTFAATRVIDGGSHAVLAGTQLAQTPRHAATATLTFDEPRIVTLAGAVRYIGARFEDDRNATLLRPIAVVDAMAARTLIHGLAGFVAVENLFDRGYVAHVAGVDQLGAPRMLHVGVRLDSARW